MINLAPLNNYIYNQPLKMEGLENLRYLLNPGDYFVKIDLSDAYLYPFQSTKTHSHTWHLFSTRSHTLSK